MIAAALLSAPAFPSPVEAPCFAGHQYNLTGRKALVITTSHSKLGDQNCSNCKPTGVYGEELTAPYLLFRDAGMAVTIATILGGDVPMDPTYNGSLMQTSFDKRFYSDVRAYADSHGTPSVADLRFTDYDIIFMAGGWGAAWDLGTSSALAAGITAAYAEKDIFIGSVCHGSLGFIQAKKADGSLVCKGTRMTGVTDRQIEQLGIAKITPLHPEDALNKAGAVYECKHGLISDLLENDVVVDGRIVTGQNQMGSCQVPQLLMGMLNISLPLPYQPPRAAPLQLVEASTCTVAWCTNKDCTQTDNTTAPLPLTDAGCEAACVQACPEIPSADISGGKGCSVGPKGNLDVGKLSPLGPGQCQCFVNHFGGFFGLACR